QYLHSFPTRRSSDLIHAYLYKYAYEAFALQRAAKGERATDAALLRELIQAECAAAEIELRFVSLHLGFQVGGDCIQVLLAALFGFEQPRFAHNAQMPRH